jgi:phosphatidylglycerol:prolipoprotein diacylglycerol transferase
MTFPVYFHAFGLRLHPHPVMEVIAYSGGFQLYLLIRRRWPRASVPLEQNLWIIVGAVFGALVGSKLLAWTESWPDYAHAFSQDGLAAFVGGKTIVGGLLGGWAGVEIAKRILHIHHSTGDAYVFPLILGMSVGRAGCFLTGLPDHTYGNRTAVPWAVDFGDGPRHPTQLYDIVFLLLLGVVLLVRMRWPYPNGRIFRLFLLAYCAYRFAVEFIKPTYRPYVGLSAIQLACLGGLIACAISVLRRTARTEPILTAASSP